MNLSVASPSSWNGWWRWPPILPAGLLAFVLSSFVAHWALLFFFWQLGGRPSDEILQRIEYPVWFGFGTYLFISIGAQVAPRHQWAVALCLAGTALVVYTAFAAAVYTYVAVGTDARVEWDMPWTAVAAVANVVCVLCGVAFGLHYVYNESDNR